MATRDSAARKFLHDFRSLMEFAESVEELGKVEAAMRDAQASKASAEKERDAALAAADKADARADAAEERERKSDATHKRIVGEAREEANRIKAEAKRQGDAIVSEARAEADRQREKAKADGKSHEHWKAQARQEREQLEGKLAELRRELDNIRKRVA